MKKNNIVLDRDVADICIRYDSIISSSSADVSTFKNARKKLMNLLNTGKSIPSGIVNSYNCFIMLKEVISEFKKNEKSMNEMSMKRFNAITTGRTLAHRVKYPEDKGFVETLKNLLSEL